MLPQQQSESFLALTKQRKNGEQPNQTKRPPNIIFSKKRPLAEIQDSEFGVDFPQQNIDILPVGKPIFENSNKIQANPQPAEPIINTPQHIQDAKIPENTQNNSDLAQTKEHKWTEIQKTLDSNSQAFKPPTLEEYSRQQNHDMVRQENAIASAEILQSLVQTGSDELNQNAFQQFHPNMLQLTSSKFTEKFQECSQVNFLQQSLICALKDQKIIIYNQNGKVFKKYVQWPVEHVFLKDDVLYVSTSEELMCIKLSESPHVGLKEESSQIIGVSAEKIIKTSTKVKDKIWVGMCQAQELVVETGRSNFFTCKSSSDFKVKLPSKSLYQSITSFFTTTNKVTQLYDLPEIDLCVSILSNVHKCSESEIQIFSRDSLKMGGYFTIGWLLIQMKNFFDKTNQAPNQLIDLQQLEILNVSARSQKQQRHLIITFKDGVSVNLYIAPSRNKQSASQITEDDISVFSIESSPVEGCLAQLDFLNSLIAPKYKPPLLSRPLELVKQTPFNKNLGLAQYEILAQKNQKNLSVFVVQQEETLLLITSLGQQSQLISGIQHILGTRFFDLAIEDMHHHVIIKIITNQGVQTYQQKTLRDHVGSYVILATKVEGGLTQAKNLYADFEELLAHYPQNEILSVLVDFIVSDQAHGQPIYHDINVQNFYFNQTQSHNLQEVKISQRIKQESFMLFEGLLRRMRDELDRSRWDLCCDVVHSVLQLKCQKFFDTYPFKAGKYGIKPALLQDALVNLEHMLDFLTNLKSEESAPVIQFCLKLREVCLFVSFMQVRTNYNFSVVLDQLFDGDKNMIEAVQFWDLVVSGLENEGLQILLENYLTYKKHDPQVINELQRQCCTHFLNQDFFELSLARQKLMRNDSSKDDVCQAVRSLCLHVNKTDLNASFDLLMENFEKYGLDPSITYLQCYIETKYVHLQWCSANKRDFENNQQIQESRLEAMDLLLEMVEELGMCVDGGKQNHPQSSNLTIQKFKTKLKKIQTQEIFSQSLKYLLLRIEKIDDSWLHKSLFALLQKLGLHQIIRQTNSKHLVQYFQEKFGSIEETPQSIQITADNLILLYRFEYCFTHIVDKCGSSRNFSCVTRSTYLRLPLQSRITLLQKAQLCLDRLEKSAERQHWQQELSLFRRLLQVQSEIQDQLKKIKHADLSEEEKFERAQLQEQVQTADQLVEICNQNNLYTDMLQAIMLKVDHLGRPLNNYQSSGIELQVLQCYQELIKSSGVDELTQKLESQFQIQEAQLQRQRDSGIFDTLQHNQHVDFFPVDQILASVFNMKKYSDQLMQMLFLQYPLADLIQICIRHSSININALISLQSVLQNMTVEQTQITNITDRNLLHQLRDLIITNFINQGLKYSVSVIKQATSTVASINKLLISL